MTENQKKSNVYLYQIRDVDKNVARLIEKIDYLRYQASGAGAIRYDKDHVQTSPEDMMCRTMAEAIDLENELYARYEKVMEMKAHTVQVISSWNNNGAKFIETYFLHHGSMSDVAKRIGCSDRHVYRIKLEALEEFSQYIV